MNQSTFTTMTPKQAWTQEMDNLRKKSADRRSPANKKPKHKQEECAPNRKAKARLDARKKDYSAMIGRVGFKAPMGAYHCPGSTKVYG